MKFLFYIAFSFLFFFALFGQPEILSNMVTTPKATLDHDYLRGNKTYITVSSHYAAKYVESNYQYRQYLNYLIENKKDSLLATVRPNNKIWDNTKLKNSEKEYLKQHYWTDKIFDDYPILGLDFYQINNYLKWKSIQLMAAYLIFTGEVDLEYLENNEFDIRQEIKADPEKWKALKLFPSLRLFTFAELAASHQYGGKSGHFNDIDKPFSKWLSNNKKFRFLIYEPKPFQLVNSSISKKLYKKLGIVPIGYSNINNRRGDVNYRQYELVMDWVRLNKSYYDKNTKIIIENEKPINLDLEKIKNEGKKILYLKRNEMVAVNFKYKNRKIRKADSRTIGSYPFFVFRTCMTRTDGAALRNFKDMKGLIKLDD